MTISEIKEALDDANSSSEMRYFCNLIKKERKIFTIIVSILCIIMIPIQFRIDYWPHKELPPIVTLAWGTFCNYGHVFLEIIVVIIIRKIFNAIATNRGSYKLLDWSDKYSYDIYLVHHVFIQSAFCCVEYIENRYVALPLAVVLTIVSAIVLNFCANKVRNLNKYYK